LHPYGVGPAIPGSADTGPVQRAFNDGAVIESLQ
jgi:hypothetical protein